MNKIVQPSSEKIEATWIDVVKPIVDQLLHKGLYFPSVQAHFNENNEMIYQRYGEHAGIHPAWDNFFLSNINQGKLTPFCCRADNGKPEVVIFADHVYALFYELLEEFQQDCPRAKCMLSVLILEGVIHEFDHLALGQVSQTPDKDKILESEFVTWGRTCQNVLLPLRDKHHLELHSKSSNMLSAWLSNPNIESWQWKTYVAERYDVTFRKWA